MKGKYAPKSIVHSGTGLFFSQHMMYRHKIVVHNRKFEVVKEIKDRIHPRKYGLQGDSSLLGGPVECTFSHEGRYAWVSNYTMIGKGFRHPGCDACSGKQYDSSFVYKINTKTFQIENIVAAGAVPKFMAAAPNNKYLLVSNWSSGDISVIDLKTEKQLKKIRVGTHPRGIAISRDSKIAYIAIMGSSRLVKLNLDNFSKENIEDVGKSPRHLVLSPNNQFLYISLNGESRIARLNLQTREIEKIKTGRLPRSMEISDDGRFLYVVNYGENTLSKIDLISFKVVDKIETKSKPIGITVDNEKGRIWVACYSGPIQVFKDKNWKLGSDQLLATTGTAIHQLSVAHPPKDTIVTPPILTQNVSPVYTTEKETRTPKIKTTPLPIKEKTTPIAPVKRVKGKAYLVVGSFSKLENAKRLAEDLQKKGYHSEVLSLEPKRNIVSAASSTDASELKSKIPELSKELDVNAWILKR